jgi:hypothetical protein
MCVRVFRVVVLLGKISNRFRKFLRWLLSWYYFNKFQLAAMPPTETVFYKFFLVISLTAKAAARAVRAMYVSDGFTHEAEVMAAPSVIKTFLQA